MSDLLRGPSRRDNWKHLSTQVGCCCLAALHVLTVRSFAAVAFFSIISSVALLSGDERRSPLANPVPAESIRVVESKSFSVHTDLGRDEATKIIERMEKTLRFAVDCWRRFNRGKIKCYLADDLERWPESALPNPMARLLITKLDGVTLSEVVGSDRNARYQATIYASTKPGVAEHEVFHAYCAQNFGTTGPDWYKEGMAEMAVFGERNSQGVQCPTERLRLLKRGHCREIHDVLKGSTHTEPVMNSLKAIHKNGKTRIDVKGDSWTDLDDERVRQIREDYVWSWALCHLLHHNANFATRFRVLGEEYLSKKEASFDQHFAAMRAELKFEYMFFASHADVGFRADLCSWDWQYRFRPLNVGESIDGRCLAARGWQPTGVVVQGGTSYGVQAAGKWGTDLMSEKTDANGNANGVGRLVGIIFDDYRLGKPFPLGATSAFEAPQSGRLYIRCQDEWNSLHDNHGDVTIRVNHAK